VEVLKDLFNAARLFAVGDGDSKLKEAQICFLSGVVKAVGSRDRPRLVEE